jgi:poly(beta-D-mannuronate) lyase
MEARSLGKKFAQRRAAASLALIAILVAGGFSTVGATYLYYPYMISETKHAPKVDITDILDKEILSAGTVEIKGVSDANHDQIQAILLSVDGGPPVIATPANPGDFSKWSALVSAEPGKHTIEVEIIDKNGNSRKSSQSTTIAGHIEEPKILSDQVVEATGPLGATVNYLPMNFKCSPLSGETFGIGKSTVSCKSKEGVQANFTVTVIDSTPPSLKVPPSIAVSSSSKFTIIQLGTATAHDIVDASPLISHNAPIEGFGVGTTEVIWTVVDDHGNSAVGIQKITVTKADAILRPPANASQGATEGATSTPTGSTTQQNPQNESSSVSYHTGGGGSGGGSSRSNDGKNPPQNDGNEEKTYFLSIESADTNGTILSGLPFAIMMSNGSLVTSGNTPASFSGMEGDTYIVSMSNTDSRAFGHWDTGSKSNIRAVILDKDINVRAHYALKPPEDHVKPSIKITFPTGSATITAATGLINISGTAYDDAAGSGVSMVEVRLDNDSLAAASPKSPGDWSNWTIGLDVRATGVHKITARATDADGNVAWNSVSVNLIIDDKPPSITVTSPKNGTSVKVGEVTLTGVSSDNLGGSGVVSLEVRLDDGEFFAAKPEAVGDWSAWTASLDPLSEGSHIIYLKASDKVGNQKQSTILVMAESAPEDVAAPTVLANPAGGIYGGDQSVTLTASEPSTIYFTTNGKTPTVSSPVYRNPISISSTATLKFIARDAAGNVGTVSTESYVIDKIRPTVTASPLGGSFVGTQMVSLSSSESAQIYYTLDGKTPTISSAVYSSPVIVASSTTLKFFARDSAGNSGPVISERYTIENILPNVTATPLGGTYTLSQSVILTPSKPSTVYYTLDGRTPTASSTKYSSPITISSSTVLKYFAIDTDGNAGKVLTQDYVIDSIPPTISISPPGGIFSSSQLVTLSVDEPASIYYTTNGNTPTISSSLYSKPILISSTKTLKYFAKDGAGNIGPVVSQTYTITPVDSTPPVVAIVEPVEETEVIVSDSTLTVVGTSSDKGSGIKMVELRVDSGAYKAATPKSPGDWSSWSVSLPASLGEHRLVPRATDNAGNQAWNSIWVTLVESPSPNPDPDPAPDPEPVPDNLPAALRTINVASVSDMSNAISSARAGDHVILKNGVYTSGSPIRVSADGTSSNPIVIRAESDGGTEISGSHGFSVSGASHVVIKGFKFTHNQDTVSTAVVCDDCVNVRFSENTFALKTTANEQSHWLGVTGASSNVRIDHNTFEDKSTEGVFLIIVGDNGKMPQATLVDHNTFRDHTYGGSNGGECVRVGHSSLGTVAANSVFEYNLFERCDGDPEVISVKSSNNVFRYNTFKNNDGSLVLRQTNSDVVDGNIFLNNNGGIRLYGANHVIINNYFEGNTGTSIRNSLIIPKGDAVALPTSSNAVYAQAKNILVAYNTFVGNSRGPIIGAYSVPYAPEDVTVANNIVTGSSGELIDNQGGQVTFKNNLLYPTGSARIGDVPSSGYTNANPQLVRSDGMMVPSENSPAINAVAASDSYGVDTDIAGNARTGLYDLGAYEVV